MNLESCTFTLNMCLVIGQNPVTRKVSVISNFKPSVWRIDEFRKLRIYFEQVFGNWTKSSYKEG